MPAQFEYYVVNAPLGLNWSDVTGDPKPKNETVLKLRKASWMWFSGRKRRRRNARETTQRGTDPVCLATDRRGQEGQRSLSGDGGIAAGGLQLEAAICGTGIARTAGAATTARRK